MNEESPDVRNNSYLYEKYYYFGTVGKRKVQTIEQEKPFDYNRFKKVREEELKLSYEAFTEESGITRTDVRLIEEGRMSFIPVTYLRFLRKKGVDLNKVLG